MRKLLFLFIIYFGYSNLVLAGWSFNVCGIKVSHNNTGNPPSATIETGQVIPIPSSKNPAPILEVVKQTVPIPLPDTSDLRNPKEYVKKQAEQLEEDVKEIIEGPETLYERVKDFYKYLTSDGVDKNVDDLPSNFIASISKEDIAILRGNIAQANDWSCATNSSFRMLRLFDNTREDYSRYLSRCPHVAFYISFFSPIDVLKMPNPVPFRVDTKQRPGSITIKNFGANPEIIVEFMNNNSSSSSFVIQDNAKLSDIGREIQKGNPVMVLIKPKESKWDLHYYLIVGIDKISGIVNVVDTRDTENYINVGEESLAKFSDEWTDIPNAYQTVGLRSRVIIYANRYANRHSENISYFQYSRKNESFDEFENNKSFYKSKIDSRIKEKINGHPNYKCLTSTDKFDICEELKEYPIRIDFNFNCSGSDAYTLYSKKTSENQNTCQIKTEESTCHIVRTNNSLISNGEITHKVCIANKNIPSDARDKILFYAKERLSLNKNKGISGLEKRDLDLIKEKIEERFLGCTVKYAYVDETRIIWDII